MRELVHREKELFALIRRTDQQLHKLAIFIHGFRGNYCSAAVQVNQRQTTP